MHNIIIRLSWVAVTLAIASTVSVASSRQEKGLDYDGKISVSIINATGQPLILSGFPSDGQTCKVDFQFDNYDLLTTKEFYQTVPSQKETSPSVLFSGCFDPEMFRANYGVQLASKLKDMGYITVTCSFDEMACDAATYCNVQRVGFSCQWTGGATNYVFTIRSATEQ